ncbi:Hypothetical protein GbCGDNIH7_8352 [Granulibacter bethesdensis]|nr:Hypothetical protein GbCGDNIH7_8352 [Granulibacter bethesdensis]
MVSNMPEVKIYKPRCLPPIGMNKLKQKNWCETYKQANWFPARRKMTDRLFSNKKRLIYAIDIDTISIIFPTGYRIKNKIMPYIINTHIYSVPF